MHESYKKWLNDGCPKVICSCGCNGEIIIKEYHKYYGIPKYINGHNRGAFGKPKSKEHIQKIRISKLGKSSWNKGIPWNKKTKEKISRNHADVSGENNPMYGIHRFGDKAPGYIDGRSYKPYSIWFNKKLKESIRKRDNYQCQFPNCLCNQLESLVLYGHELSIHHIHYDKESKETELITLCIKCNSIVNKNRNYWEKYFMEKIKKEFLIDEKRYRIWEILYRIRLVWMKNPDLRLGQLIGNVINPEYLYEIEDDSLVKMIEDIYDT